MPDCPSKTCACGFSSWRGSRSRETIVWDNPRLANVAANALYALALALVVYAGARVLFESPVFSLKTIVVGGEDRKSTRLNSSHQIISYAVFCLKNKNDDRQSTHETSILSVSCCRRKKAVSGLAVVASGQWPVISGQ